MNFLLENGLGDCHAVKSNFCYFCSPCLVNKLWLRDVSLEFPASYDIKIET